MATWIRLTLAKSEWNTIQTPGLFTVKNLHAMDEKISYNNLIISSFLSYSPLLTILLEYRDSGMTGPSVLFG